MAEHNATTSALQSVVCLQAAAADFCSLLAHPPVDAAAGAAYAALTTAQYKIWSSPENITTNDEVAMGMKHAALLYAAFSTALGRLLEMPDSATTAEAVSQATNVSAPISCPNVPSRDQLPLALGEWCVPAAGQPGRTADTRDNERDCSDPYAAYVQWCAPALCHTLGPKSHYLQVRLTQ